MKLTEVKNNFLLGFEEFAKEIKFKIVKKDFEIKKSTKEYACAFQFDVDISETAKAHPIALSGNRLKN